MEFRRVVTVKHRGTTAVDHSIRDDAVDQILVLRANVTLVNALGEVSCARAESSAGSVVGAGFFDMLYHLRTESITGCPSVVGSTNGVTKGIDSESA